MILFYYFFASLQLLLGFISLKKGADFYRFFKSRRSGSADRQPFASLIVPCRGIEPGLKKNLSALTRQDYFDYELLFVVDDARDDAVRVIEEVISTSPRQARLIIAGTSGDTGQKIHNLIAAVTKASDRSEVFVFADSDTEMTAAWMRNLVAPLDDKSVGCATGYRWFIQENGGLATHLRSVWNASIASALGEDDLRNFCWGGSTAIRRETFERLRISEVWQGTVSDDFVLTRCLQDNGLLIRFVPGCLSASVGDCGIGGLLEFTNRQMKITRVYSPALWRLSFISSALFVAVFWTGPLLMFFVPGRHLAAAGIITFVLFLTGSAKAWLRLKAVSLVLPGHKSQLRRQYIWHLILWPLTPFLFLINDLAALFSKKIVWRGIAYELESAESTRVSERNGQ